MCVTIFLLFGLFTKRGDDLLLPTQMYQPAKFYRPASTHPGDMPYGHRVTQLDMILSLTYLCDLDTDLYNGLRPPSAYAAVVRLPTTAAFLVLYATTNARMYFTA